MLGLGESTKIKKIIPKKIIFEKFKKDLNPNRRNSFNDEISRITLTNEISPHSLNIEEGKEIKNVFVIKLDVKKEKISDVNISILSRFFGQKILYLISYEGRGRLAIFQEKLFQTDYQNIDEIQIELEGLNLDTIWENLVLSISGYEIQEDKTLEEQIKIEEKRNKLIKQIERLDRQGRRESQPKKSFEIYQKMKKLKKELEEL